MKTLYFLSVLFLSFTVKSQSHNFFSSLNEKDNICKNIENFRHKKAKNPMLENYDIKFTKINIETDNTSDYIDAFAIIEAEVTAEILDTFCIELSSAMVVDSVFFDNNFIDFTHTNNEIKIYLDVPVLLGNSFSFAVYYSGFGNDNNNYAGGLHHISGESLFNYEHLTYSFTQPFGANLWFPCKQILSDKIDSLHIFVTTNSSYKVSSNGILTNTVNLANNKTRFEWKTNYPIAYYLVAFNIFNYSEYNFYTYPVGFEDSVFIQNFMVDEFHISEMQNELDKTHDAMNLFCNLLDFYPFKSEKYGHSIWGRGFGMEHQTITSMPYEIDFRRLSHELSHQWFGNSVTCGTWRDIWLNEGFATYFDYLALKLLVSNSTGEERMQYYHTKAMTNGYGSVYVPEEDENNASRIFNYNLSYCKAASVVKMLRFELQNDELFWQTLRNYLSEFKDSTAVTQDFKNILEETTGNNFDYFFEQWIYGEGYPIYYGDWYQENDTLIINVNQFASFPITTSFFKMLMQYQINYAGGDTLILLEQEQRNQTFKLFMPYPVDNIIIDPNNETLNRDYGIVAGTLENEKINYKIYPNPFSDEFKILISGTNFSENYITLYDITGNIILDDIFTGQEYIVNTSKLKTGIYYIKIKSKTEIYTQKIVKY